MKKVLSKLLFALLTAVLCWVAYFLLGAWFHRLYHKWELFL